jgi:hypothetical protein
LFESLNGRTVGELVEVTDDPPTPAGNGAV